MAKLESLIPPNSTLFLPEQMKIGEIGSIHDPGKSYNGHLVVRGDGCLISIQHGNIWNWQYGSLEPPNFQVLVYPHNTRFVIKQET